MSARLSHPLPSRRRGGALAGLLASACADMRRLQAYAETFVTRGKSAFSRDQVEALCGFLDQASAQLRSRIAHLGREGCRRLEEPRPRCLPCGKNLRARALIGAYRTCCRHLCRALHAAKRLGDAITASLLADVVRRLEKQLWLLDPRSGACRGAALFYGI